MQRKIINGFLGLLFSLTFLVSVFCLTALSKNFVLQLMRENNYYDQVYDEMSNYFDGEYSISISKKDVREDIESYVKSRYKDNYFKFRNQEYRSDYNRFIKFNDYFKNVDICLIIYLIYLLDFFLIVITGILFLKTKHIHSLNVVIIINFIVSFVVYGIMVLFVDSGNEFINVVITKFSHYYLAVAIILFELVIFGQIKKD